MIKRAPLDRSYAFVRVTGRPDLFVLFRDTRHGAGFVREAKATNAVTSHDMKPANDNGRLT